MIQSEGNVKVELQRKLNVCWLVFKLTHLNVYAHSLSAHQATQMCTSYREHAITKTDKQDVVTGSTAHLMM